MKLTLLARLTDGLPLAEGLDTDKSSNLEQYKQQAKVIIERMTLLIFFTVFSRKALHCILNMSQQLFKKLSQGQAPPSRMTMETGALCFQYVFSFCVVYCCIVCGETLKAAILALQLHNREWCRVPDAH